MTPGAGGEVETMRDDLVLVSPNLGDGGTQKVVALLAGAWSRRGKRVCVVTLYDKPDFYALPEDVRRVSLGGDSLRIFRMLRELLSRVPLLWPNRGPEWVRRVRSVVIGCAGTLIRGVRWLCVRTLGERGLELLVWTLPVTAARVRGLRTTVRRSHPSVVVAFGGSTGVVTALACRGSGTRLVVSERNDPSRQTLAFPWNDLRPRTYGAADVVTANARGTLETLRQWVPRDRLRFIPNPLAMTPGHGATHPPHLNHPGILIVGRLHPQKGHDILFRAVQMLPEPLRTWKVWVLGRGDSEVELRRLAADLEIDDRVDWHGQVADVGPFYSAAEIFVLPSRYEGTPNALLEAMSFGLTCIVTDASPGPLEVVRHGETGFVVPAEDPGALASALARLAHDPQERRRVGTQARHALAESDLGSVLCAWEEAFGWPTGVAVAP